MITSILDSNLSSCAGVEILLGMFPSDLSNHVLNSLLDLGCKVYPAKTPQDAINKLQFHSFPITILEENYSMQIMQLMACLPMVIRRNIFYMVIGSNLETGNMMQSFILSANFIVNYADLQSFGQIFQAALLNYNHFYRPFQNASEKISQGRGN